MTARTVQNDRLVDGAKLDNLPVDTNASLALKVDKTTMVNGHALSSNVTVTASDVGLGNVDNTSDLNKPISTATQTALNAKQGTITLTTTGTSGAATLVGDVLNIPNYVSGGGTGDVVGPSSAVDGNFAAFDGTDGKKIKDSGKSAADFATSADISEMITSTSQFSTNEQVVLTDVSSTYTDTDVIYVSNNDSFLYKRSLSGIGNGTAINSTTSTTPTASQDGSYIVYTNTADGFKLYKKNSSDIGNGTAITTVGGQYPQISSDGLYIYYMNSSDAKIYKKSATDTSDGTAIYTGLTTYFKLSPDGNYIVIVYSNQMFVKSTSDVDNTTLLTSNVRPSIRILSFFPDSTNILYCHSSFAIYKKSIFVVDDGTSTSGNYNYLNADINSVGDSIVFSNDSSSSFICTTDINFGSLSYLTSVGGTYPIFLKSGTPTPSRKVKTSSKTIVTTLGTDDTTLPTSKAVKDVTDGKASLSGATFTGAISATNLSGTNTGDNAANTTSNSYADGKVSDTAYDSTSWDGVTTIAPSKNAVRDKIESIEGEIGLKQNVFAGIDESTPVTVSVNYTTRVLTVTPTGASFNYYTDGSGVSVKHTISGPVNFPAFTDTSGIWYFYFDNSGGAVSTQTAWTDFSLIAPVYRIVWNSTKSPDSAKSITEYKETHANTIPAIDHLWKHTYGAVYVSGLDIASNFIASGSPNADGRNAVVALSTGSCMDDNLLFTHTNSTGGGLFQQDLGNTTPASLNATNSAILNIRYRGVGGASELVTGTRFPFLWDSGTNRPQYVDSSGNRQLVTANYYFVYFVYELGDQRNGQGIRITPAYNQYSNLTNAQAVTWDTIKAQDPLVNDPEIRPLYRLIFEYRSSYDVGTKYSALREILDIRKAIVAQTTNLAGSLPATSITNTPAGNISATNVQDAINELDTEKVPTSRTITINGTAYDLSANRTWTVEDKGIWATMPGTPTRTSNTTFTVTGDVTSYVSKGMIIKWTESSTVRCAMVSIPSTYSAPDTTITIVGDTMASIDASSLKYCTTVGAENFIARFAIGGKIGANGTNVTNSDFASLGPCRVIGADLEVGTVASTSGSTTIDINKNGSTMFTTKPTLAYNVKASPLTFTADSGTSLALNDEVTIDIDGVTSTTYPTDLYVKLYYFPTRILSLT